MIQKTWRVLLSVAFVMLVFCAVRAVRRPAASDAAQRTEVSAGRAQAEENENVTATNELQVRQLETARDAQWMKQQEAAQELQRRQQEATHPPSQNSGLSLEAADVAAGG